MKKLYLLRHGEAESAFSADDKDRRLTLAGQRSLEELRDVLTRDNIEPEICLCSTAIRTKMTRNIVLPSVETEYSDTIYTASPTILLQIIKDLDDAVNSVVLVGHNPAIHELAHMLARQGDQKVCDRLSLEFRPGTWVSYDLDIDHWEDLMPSRSAITNLLIAPYQ
jgi:phosphohistidine phosphatase